MRTRRPLRLLAPAAILVVAPLAAATAHADPTSAAPPRATVTFAEPAVLAPNPAPVESPSRWYGWQTLGADISGWVMLVGAGSSQSTGLGYASLGTLALGAPIIHAAHENWGAAAGSLAIRTLGTVTAALVTAALTPNNPNTNSWNLDPLFNGVIAGGVVLLGAAVLDAAVFAYEPRPSAERAKDSVPRDAAKITVTPNVGMVRGGATVGVGGTLF